MKENRNEVVLLVDDEEHILTTASISLKSSGIAEVLTLSDSSKVLPLLESRPISAIVLDLQMPKLSGQELLPKIVKNYPQTPVLLMTADDSIQTVIDAMKSGAFDYLVKPVDSNQLVSRVKKALELGDITSELHLLKERLLTDNLDHPEAFAEMITENKSMRALFQYIEVIAKTRQPIMITGETGVGKELVARAIHLLSERSGPYVPINVAGLDDNMLSDTLFGHRKGAFTGADQPREGLVEKAARGTLFLDEIGDLNEASQIKLLRLLQEQEYYPVGSDLLKKSSARIVLATNRDLQSMINEGTFRKDLYFRLFAHRVHIPPLRERSDDIPLLLGHMLKAAAVNLGKKTPTPPPELAVLLSLYPFPGNIRELEALVFDAVARHVSGILSMESFRAVIDDRQLAAAEFEELGAGQGKPLLEHFGHFPSLAEVEDYMIAQAMEMTHGNQGMAAKLLGIGRQTLNKRLNK